MNKPYLPLIAIISLIGLLFFAIGCQDQAEKAELQKFKAQITLQEQNKALVKKLMEGLNDKNLQMYEEVYASNCAFYFPSAGSNPISRDADMASSKNNWRAFPDIHWTIEDMVAEGNMVATRFIATGTQQQEWNGVPSLAKKFQGTGIFTVRIENGKVVEQREDFDLLGVFQQLGMELKPSKSKK
jgi:steroid delta-isomerase-like uncharacterized protein